jgi:predicted nucleic acid-binding protein
VTVVVDTNIVISAIISDKGKIGELLLFKPENLRFFSPKYLPDELDKHHKKVKAITDFSDTEYDQVRKLVRNGIEFFDIFEIENKNLEKGYKMASDIDPKGAIFLALCLEKNSGLWKGDKKLIKGLERIGYDNILTTSMLYAEFIGE